MFNVIKQTSVCLFILLCCGLSASAAEKPVKVYILSGQSNMVGIGQVTGGGTRWGANFTDIEVSVYEGAYDAAADYDALKPLKTTNPESFGGVNPTPYPGGGTHVARGFITVKDTGVYEFRPGYGGSTANLMKVDGKLVHKKTVDGVSRFTPIKLCLLYTSDAADE